MKQDFSEIARSVEFVWISKNYIIKLSNHSRVYFVQGSVEVYSHDNNF